MQGEGVQHSPQSDARLQCLKPVLGRQILHGLLERAEQLHKDALVCNLFLFTEKYPGICFLIIISTAPFKSEDFDSEISISLENLEGECGLQTQKEE